MGWDALCRWGDARMVDQLSGGVRNDVRLVEIDGERRVARLGSRSFDDLAWEVRLLAHLDAAGLSVPKVVPTLDGLLVADGITVMEHVGGRPPESQDDWQRVACYLRRLHALTIGWPQRPGWASSIDLLTSEVGTSVDLTAMPAQAVARCRAAWARLAQGEPAVVHGDPNAGNVRITDQAVTLIDWDEARVDVAGLDLVLPHNAAGLDREGLVAAAQAASAWEAAVCWSAEPEYAARRLSEVGPA